MLIISSILRKVAHTILATGVDPHLLPKFFEALEAFLTKEPIESFTHIELEPHEHLKHHLHQLKPTPLEMRRDTHAEERLKAELYKVAPSLAEAVDTAKHGETFVNFLHILGQIFTVTALILESTIERIQDEKLKEKIQHACKSFYDIWGGYASMNAHKLIGHYSGMSNEAARDHLIEQFRKSTQVVEQEILPLLDMSKSQ